MDDVSPPHDRDRLLAVLAGLPGCVVAFSGGVDSTVVAKAAQLALGDRAEAATADSPSVPRHEVAEAVALAECIGIRHRLVPTTEFTHDAYTRNDAQRCYHCKSELYGALDALRSVSSAVIVSGANRDDLGDYRPGLRAAAERGVRHPLIEAGLGKAAVRQLARFWELPVWDKPASPCLASRLAPGVAVTPERTARVEAAELLLRELGLRECRVRLHEGELARIEVPLTDVSRIAAEHERLSQRFRALGFRYVTLDLEGFRSGNLNGLLSLGLPGGTAG